MIMIIIIRNRKLNHSYKYLPNKTCLVVPSPASNRKFSLPKCNIVDGLPRSLLGGLAPVPIIVRLAYVNNYYIKCLITYKHQIKRWKTM